jgi:PH (Pleckstrin Homology) domain-containing protein
MSQAPTDVIELLGPNEQVELYIQQKIYHPKINIDSVLLTNERIILRHPHALGLKKGYTDFSYTDIANVLLEKGIIRSTVKCVLRFGGDPLALQDLPNTEAERAYGIIRENLVRYQTPLSYAQGSAGPGVVVAPQIVTREVVKVRCKYCNQLMDENATTCPS